MKKTLNIFLIFLSSVAIGYWGELVELSTSDFLPISTKISENTEGEVETETASYFGDKQKNDKSGDGGNALKIQKFFVHIAQSRQNLSCELKNDTHFEASNSIKAYNNRLINSIKTPKLFILFRCSKTFLS